MSVSVSVSEPELSGSPFSPTYSYTQCRREHAHTLPHAMTSTTQPTQPTPLRIIQQNLNKSLTAQLAFLHEYTPDNTDIIALQEPYKDFKNLTRTTPFWYVIYPATHARSPEATRSILLINRRLPTDSWTEIITSSPVLTAVTLRTPTGPIHLFVDVICSSFGSFWFT